MSETQQEVKTTPEPVWISCDEYSETGRLKRSIRTWHCPCGADMELASRQNIFGGEINHSQFVCLAGHVWNRNQVDWERWAWKRGEVWER